MHNIYYISILFLGLVTACAGPENDGQKICDCIEEATEKASEKHFEKCESMFEQLAKKYENNVEARRTVKRVTNNCKPK